MARENRTLRVPIVSLRPSKDETVATCRSAYSCLHEPKFEISRNFECYPRPSVLLQPIAFHFCTQRKQEMLASLTCARAS